MKPAAFAYERPGTGAEAVDLLRQGGGTAKILAGGQSLAPMLNMRLAQPRLLVDITGIAEFKRADADGDWLELGACVTHADVEDGRTPDVTAGFLPAVGAGIAYRAVRNRGTVCGSLAHADPAADWVSALTLAGATAVVAGPRGRREVAAVDFMAGTFEVDLADDELLEAVRVPRFGNGARWGFYKVCRRTGEFAAAIGAVLSDRERGVCRAVVGGTGSKPLVMDDARGLFGTAADADARLPDFDPAAGNAWLEEGGLSDPVDRQIHLTALTRAIAQAAT